MTTDDKEIDVERTSLAAASVSAFRAAAACLQSVGLAVLPLGGADGKTPLVGGFTAWRGPPSAATVAAWCERFPHAGIGVACGPSKKVVVDVDDPELIDRVLDAFGPTPLITSTPGGGIHCWYEDRFGQADRALRPRGLPIDIKAKGGFVVVPPSVNPTRGKCYEFWRGDWSDVKSLPPFDPRSIERVTRGHAGETYRTIDGKVGIGHRNNMLLKYLVGLAPWPSLEEVTEEALRYNRTQNEVPEEESKVVRTARSAWDYQRRGQLPNRDAFVQITQQEMDLLGERGGKDYPVALALLVKLRRSHGAGARAEQPFALAAEAMVRDKVIPGVSDRKRIDRAKVVLLRTGLIECVEEAKPSSRRPALFLLRHQR